MSDVQPMMLDTSEHQPVHLIKGENGIFVRLSPSAYQLLCWSREGRSYGEMAELVNESGAKTVTAAEIETSCRKMLSYLDDVEKKKNTPSRGFLFHVPLLSPKLVGRISSCFGALFSSFGWVTASIAGLAYLVFLYRSVLGFSHPPQVTASAFALYFLSLVFHEFGHSSACLKFGEPPSAIGVTMYLCFPALYADVTGTWRLPRRQRVLVDLGGIYFQALTATVYFLAFRLSGWIPLQAAVFLVFGSILFQLNPIFRFDGYWLITDALGVSNLGKQPNRLMSYFSSALFRKSTAHLPWPRFIIGMLFIYSMVAIGIWTYFISKLLPTIKIIWVNYPSQVRNLWTRDLHQLGLGRTLVQTLLSAIPLLLLLLFIYRHLKPVTQNALRAYRDKKASRHGLAPLPLIKDEI